MGYSATKMIYKGTAYSKVGSVVEAILKETNDASKVYEWFGEKTASLASAVSVAKKNLGLNIPKPTAAKKPVEKKVSSSTSSSSVDSKDTKFCPECGKQNKYSTISAEFDLEGVLKYRTISIKCSCGKHSQIKI